MQWVSKVRHEIHNIHHPQIMGCDMGYLGAPKFWFLWGTSKIAVDCEIKSSNDIPKKIQVNNKISTQLKKLSVSQKIFISSCHSCGPQPRMTWKHTGIMWIFNNYSNGKDIISLFRNSRKWIWIHTLKIEIHNKYCCVCTKPLCIKKFLRKNSFFNIM